MTDEKDRCSADTEKCALVKLAATCSTFLLLNRPKSGVAGRAASSQMCSHLCITPNKMRRVPGADTLEGCWTAKKQWGSGEIKLEWSHSEMPPVDLLIVGPDAAAVQREVQWVRRWELKAIKTETFDRNLLIIYSLLQYCNIYLLLSDDGAQRMTQTNWDSFCWVRRKRYWRVLMKCQ